MRLPIRVPLYPRSVPASWDKEGSCCWFLISGFAFRSNSVLGCCPSCRWGEPSYLVGERSGTNSASALVSDLGFRGTTDTVLPPFNTRPPTPDRPHLVSLYPRSVPPRNGPGAATNRAGYRCTPCIRWGVAGLGTVGALNVWRGSPSSPACCPANPVSQPLARRTSARFCDAGGRAGEVELLDGCLSDGLGTVRGVGLGGGLMGLFELGVVIMADVRG